MKNTAGKPEHEFNMYRNCRSRKAEGVICVAIILPNGVDEREEFMDAAIEHIRWGLRRAAETGDVEGIRRGTIAELSSLTCPAGSSVPQIPEERLRRRLVRNSTSQPFAAWEYLLLCFDLGISTNPYVEDEHDRAHGYLAPSMIAGKETESASDKKKAPRGTF